MDQQQETCEMCGHVAPAKKHPCRFEKACACWYSEPCGGTGKSVRAIYAARREQKGATV